MTIDIASLLDQTLDLVHRRLDRRRIADAKRRQADMFAWRESDYLPIDVAAPVPETAGLPSFDWAQQFADPAVSLYMQLRNVVLPHLASGCDYVPAVRADTGVINGPTVLGAPYAVPAHTKPVVTAHVPREQLAAFEVPDDISGLGVLPTMVEHTQHHLAVLKDAGLRDRVGVHHCDLQGPFDIAAQARGHDEIFLDLYEDPEFLHALLAKSTDIFIKMARLSKSLAGDGVGGGYANEYWMDAGSVRLCDDSGILVSPGQYAGHLAGALGQALAPFGGGWLHYCGGVPQGGRPEGLHLHEIYLSVPGLRALNYTTGKDEPQVLRDVLSHKVAVIGGFFLRPGESFEDNFRRVLRCCPGRVGLIFRPDVWGRDATGAVELWRRLQDEMLP